MADPKSVDDLLNEDDDLDAKFKDLEAHPKVLEAVGKGLKALLPIVEVVAFGSAEIAAAVFLGPQGGAAVAQIVQLVYKLMGPSAASAAQAHYSSSTK